MAIKEEYLIMKWHNTTKKYYESLGYVFTKYGDELKVFIKHVKSGSHSRITAICDSCGAERSCKMNSYHKLCKNCHLLKLNNYLDNNPDLRKKIANLSWENRSDEDKEKAKNRLKGVIGENHPSWNWQKDPKERKIGRTGAGDKKWSKDIKIKYNYTCSICHSNRIVESHHLMSYNIYPELRLDLNNGVCLCVDCHKEFHKQYGFHNNTKDQFEEFCRIIDLSKWVK